MENESISSDSSGRLAVGCFCATFLKPEMLHIYRQITGLERYRGVVFTQSRECREEFPYSQVVELAKARSRFFRRLWRKQILREPIQIYPAEARMFIETMRASDIRLLHVYFGHIGVYLLPLLRMSPWPVVVSFHGADVGVDMQKPAHLRAMREVLALARLVLVRSHSLRDGVVALGCDPGKIYLHRTGIPLDAFAFRQRTPPVDGAWHLVQACRLIPKKGLDLTLEVVARFQKAHPAARLTIAGDGPLLHSLQVAAARLGVRVKFAGFLSQDQLQALYYDAHIFIHPSRTDSQGNQEGVPNSMLEAMATGMPVVATRHGGIPEAVVDAMGGFLCREDDAEGLYKSLRQLTDSPVRYADMGKAASDSVREHFERRAQIAQLEVLYDKALA